MTTTTGVARIGETKTPSIGDIACAGAIGTIIEWYDFLIYGTAAALVFNSQFFPNVDPRIGTLAALGSFHRWISRAADRRRDLWPFRRPAGPQIHAHAHHGRHGPLDRGDRRAAELWPDRDLGAGASGFVACGAGHRAGRRMGRCIADGAGARAAASAGTIRQPGSGRISHRPGLGLGGVFPGRDACRTPISKHGAGAFPSSSACCLSRIGIFVRARLPETPVFEDIKSRGQIVRSPLLEMLVNIRAVS